MAKTFRYQHLRTSTSGRVPSTSEIREGEIAVNIAADGEKLFLKNTNNQIVKFIPEAQIDAKIAASGGSIGSDVQAVSGAVDTVSGAVNTLDTKKLDVSAYTAYTAATNTTLGSKANAADVYTTANTYTKTEVNNNIKDFFDGAEYNSTDKRINFKHGSTVKAYIDATDFIKDGMVDNVEVKAVNNVTCLVITFNTDSGKEAINVPIADIFDATNYYTKSEIDTALNGKSNTGHTHTASDITNFDAAVSGSVKNNSAVREEIIKEVTASSEFNSAVSGAVKNNTDVQNTVISAVTASTEFTTLTGNVTTISGNVNTISGNVNTVSGNVNTVSGTVNTHTANTTIHITSSERTTWNGKQAALVSGTNIKTVASKGLLGSGNVEISITDLSTSGSGDVTVDGDFIILDAGTF